MAGNREGIMARGGMADLQRTLDDMAASFLTVFRPQVESAERDDYYRQLVTSVLWASMFRASTELGAELATRGRSIPGEREQGIMLLERAGRIAREWQQHPDSRPRTGTHVPHSGTNPEQFREAISILDGGLWQQRMSQATQGVMDGAVERIPPGTTPAERRRITDSIAMAVLEGAARAEEGIPQERRADYRNVHALSMLIAQRAADALSEVRDSVDQGSVDPMESFSTRADEFPDPVQFSNAYFVGELCLGMVQRSEEGFLIRRGTLEGNLLAGQVQVERWLYTFAAGHVRDPQAQLNAITLVESAMHEARESLTPRFRHNIERGSSDIPSVDSSSWFIVEQARAILEERRDQLRENPGGRRVRVTPEDFQQAINLLNRAVSEAAPFGRARPSLRE